MAKEIIVYRNKRLEKLHGVPGLLSMDNPLNMKRDNITRIMRHFSRHLLVKYHDDNEDIREILNEVTDVLRKLCPDYLAYALDRGLIPTPNSTDSEIDNFILELVTSGIEIYINTKAMPSTIVLAKLEADYPYIRITQTV